MTCDIVQKNKRKFFDSDMRDWSLFQVISDMAVIRATEQCSQYCFSLFRDFFSIKAHCHLLCIVLHLRLHLPNLINGPWCYFTGTHEILKRDIRSTQKAQLQKPFKRLLLGHNISNTVYWSCMTCMALWKRCEFPEITTSKMTDVWFCVLKVYYYVCDMYATLPHPYLQTSTHGLKCHSI